MALHFGKPEVSNKKSTKGAFSYAAWYNQNKGKLSQKRKLLYHENAEYRQRALESSRHQRSKKLALVVDEFDVSFNRMATQLGVTIWTLREWRKKDYYPEPVHKNGRLWFSTQQIGALKNLKNFFDVHGVRVSLVKRSGLDELIALVYANWN